MNYHQPECGGCQLTDSIFVADLLGLHRDGPQVQDVLDGMYIAPDISTQETRDFLDACKYVKKGIEEIMQDLLIIDLYRTLRNSWKCRRELTTSYHHHMGHYKAVMCDDYLSWFFFQQADNYQSSVH